MRLSFFFVSLLIVNIAAAHSQKPGDVAPFIAIDSPVFVLNHVRVTDGTGTAPKEDEAVRALFALGWAF